MADYRLLAAGLVLTFLPSISLDHAHSTSTSEAPFSNEFCSESPSEMHYLSAWRDSQDNVWGPGDGNLWWFNATNLSWSLLPLPNGTSTSDSWKVTCGNPLKYVALQGPSGTFVLHLPWQHWQQVDTDDVSGGRIDANASWCSLGILYAVDSTRQVLYQLDHEEARWVVQSDLSDIDDINSTAVTRMAMTWLGPDGQFILFEIHDTYSHVIATNASGMSWTVLAKDAGDVLWPKFNLKTEKVALTWHQGSDKLWLWKSEDHKQEMWSFDMNTTKWERVNRNFESRLTSLYNVIATWVDKDKFCILEREPICISIYCLTHTKCLLEQDIKSFGEAPPLTTVVTPGGTTKPILGNSTPLSRVISPPSTTSETISSGKPSTAKADSLTKPTVTRHTTQKSWRTSERESDIITIIPDRNTPWHQHTSVFGSVIFFGTSLTIFGLVGVFWCVRRCVHFPKEALLLRDPPSVRYTAIPDSMGYDSRKPTPATYTVIPDAIA